MRYSVAEIGGKRAIGLALWDDKAWVAIDDGVAWFDGRGWRPDRSLPTKNATAIAAGPSGVWLIDRDATLAHFDGDWDFENLRSTLEDMDWDECSEGGEPQLRVAEDGALWLLWGGLWRKGHSGWREYPVKNVDWRDAVMLAHGSGDVWLRNSWYIFELRLDHSLGALYRPRDLPIDREYGLFDVARTAAGNTWLASSKDLLALEGGKWRRHGLPPGGTVVKEVAAAGDGSVWVVSENRPIWRIALWLARPLAATIVALLTIGILAVVWAGSASKKRWATHRAVMRTAGIVLLPDEAATERSQEKRDRGLWWKLPLFLAGFPYLVEGPKWLRMYFEGVWPDAPTWVPWSMAVAPIGAVPALLAVRWLRERSKPMPAVATETLFIRTVLYMAVCSFFASKLPSGGATWNSVALAVGVLMLMRNYIAQRLTNPLLASGDYERALTRLRWLSFPRPTAWMAFQKGIVLGALARHAEAERSYCEVLAVSANAKPAFRNHLLLCLGYTLTDLGRYEEALRCLETVIDLGDAYGGARLGIADLLLQQGKEPGKALSLVEESMRICSAGWYKAERMGNKAWALALMGKCEEMADPMTVALKGIEGLKHAGVAASIRWRVGKALAAAERVSEAIEQFRAALRIDPHGQHGLLAKTELANYGEAG